MFTIHFRMTNIKVISKNIFTLAEFSFSHSSMPPSKTVQTAYLLLPICLGMNGLKSHLNSYTLLCHNTICSDVSVCILILIFQSGCEKQEANDSYESEYVVFQLTRFASFVGKIIETLSLLIVHTEIENSTEYSQANMNSSNNPPTTLHVSIHYNDDDVLENPICYKNAQKRNKSSFVRICGDIVKDIQSFSELFAICLTLICVYDVEANVLRADEISKVYVCMWGGDCERFRLAEFTFIMYEIPFAHLRKAV